MCSCRVRPSSVSSSSSNNSDSDKIGPVENVSTAWSHCVPWREVSVPFLPRGRFCPPNSLASNVLKPDYSNPNIFAEQVLAAASSSQAALPILGGISTIFLYPFFQTLAIRPTLKSCLFLRQSAFCKPSTLPILFLAMSLKGSPYRNP